jgi:hypothetical protein
MTFKNRPRTYVLVAVAVLAALSLIGASTSASSTPRASQVAALAPDAPPPLVITYQGRLVNPSTGEPKPDGSYTAMFELFNVDAGGAAIWSEKQDIVVSKGLFSVTLGNQAGNPIDPGLFDGYGAGWAFRSIQTARSRRASGWPVHPTPSGRTWRATRPTRIGWGVVCRAPSPPPLTATMPPTSFRAI